MFSSQKLPYSETGDLSAIIRSKQAILDNFITVCSDLRLVKEEEAHGVSQFVAHIINVFLEYSNVDSKVTDDLTKILKTLVDVSQMPGMKDIFIETVAPTVFKTITDPWINDLYGKEILEHFNLCLRGSDKVTRAKIITNNNSMYLSKLLDFVTICGDYHYQIVIMECIFRMCPFNKLRELSTNLIPEDENMRKAFNAIEKDTFDYDVRIFLNIVNEKWKYVYSIVCEAVYIDNIPLSGPLELQENGLWVDFNRKSKTISWYVDESFSGTEGHGLLLLPVASMKKCLIKKLSDTINVIIELQGELIVKLSTIFKPKRVVFTMKRTEKAEILIDTILDEFCSEIEYLSQDVPVLSLSQDLTPTIQTERDSGQMSSESTPFPTNNVIEISSDEEDEQSFSREFNNRGDSAKFLFVGNSNTEETNFSSMIFQGSTPVEESSSLSTTSKRKNNRPKIAHIEKYLVNDEEEIIAYGGREYQLAAPASAISTVSFGSLVTTLEKYKSEHSTTQSDELLQEAYTESVDNSDMNKSVDGNTEKLKRSSRNKQTKKGNAPKQKQQRKRKVNYDSDNTGSSIEYIKMMQPKTKIHKTDIVDESETPSDLDQKTKKLIEQRSEKRTLTQKSSQGRDEFFSCNDEPLVIEDDDEPPESEMFATASSQITVIKSDINSKKSSKHDDFEIKQEILSDNSTVKLSRNEEKDLPDVIDEKLNKSSNYNDFEIKQEILSDQLTIKLSGNEENDLPIVIDESENNSVIVIDEDEINEEVKENITNANNSENYSTAPLSPQKDGFFMQSSFELMDKEPVNVKCYKETVHPKDIIQTVVPEDSFQIPKRNILQTSKDITLNKTKETTTCSKKRKLYNPDDVSYLENTVQSNNQSLVESISKKQKKDLKDNKKAAKQKRYMSDKIPKRMGKRIKLHKSKPNKIVKIKYDNCLKVLHENIDHVLKKLRSRFKLLKRDLKKIKQQKNTKKSLKSNTTTRGKKAKPLECDKSVYKNNIPEGKRIKVLSNILLRKGSSSEVETINKSGVEDEKTVSASLNQTRQTEEESLHESMSALRIDGSQKHEYVLNWLTQSN